MISSCANAGIWKQWYTLTSDTSHLVISVVSSNIVSSEWPLQHSSAWWAYDAETCSSLKYLATSDLLSTAQHDEQMMLRPAHHLSMWLLLLKTASLSLKYLRLFIFLGCDLAVVTSFCLWRYLWQGCLSWSWWVCGHSLQSSIWFSCSYAVSHCAQRLCPTNSFIQTPQGYPRSK